MNKFVYSVFFPNDGVNPTENVVQTIMAIDTKDAQNRIIKEFWNLYDDLEEDEWNDFVDELYDKYDIFISRDITDIEAL